MHRIDSMSPALLLIILFSTFRHMSLVMKDTNLCSPCRVKKGDVRPHLLASGNSVVGIVK